MEGFWVGVGAAGTFVLAILAIYKWQVSKVKVVGTVRRYPAMLPSKLRESLSRVSREPQLYKDALSELSNSDQGRKVAENINNLITELEKMEMVFFSHNECSELEIHNAGHDEARNIGISAEAVFLIEAEEKGKWSEFNGESISLRPNERKKFRIWRRRSFGRKIEVLQERGRVSIHEFEFAHPTFSVMGRYLKNEKIFMFFIFILVLSFLVKLSYSIDEFFDNKPDANILEKHSQKKS